MISCYAHKVRQKYCAKGSRETDFHPLEKVRRCVVIHDAPSFFSLTIKIDSFF